MKFNIKKIKIENVLMISVAILSLLYLYRSCKERYENGAGPSAEITQEDLDLIFELL